MKLRLMLVAINKRQWVNNEGDDVIKYQHIFLSENNKGYIGWSDNDDHKVRLADTNTYDDARAHAYDVSLDVINDKLRYKVVLPTSTSH